MNRGGSKHSGKGAAGTQVWKGGSELSILERGPEKDVSAPKDIIAVFFSWLILTKVPA